MKNDDVPPRVLQTISRTARDLDISETSIKKLIHEGKLEAVKIGSARRVTVASVEAYVATLPRV